MSPYSASMSDPVSVGLDELRRLAAVLPPSERVVGGEVADVLSGVVALVKHGPGIVTAAEEGADKVIDFLFDKQAQDHEARNIEPPVKGAGQAGGPQPSTAQDQTSSQVADLSARFDSERADLDDRLDKLTQLVENLATAAPPSAAAGGPVQEPPAVSAPAPTSPLPDGNN